MKTWQEKAAELEIENHFLRGELQTLKNKFEACQYEGILENYEYLKRKVLLMENYVPYVKMDEIAEELRIMGF